MKVLYQSRPKDKWIGGDMFQLERTMEEMEKLGVETEFNDQPLIKPALRLRSFDIVHTFSFTLPWTKYQIWAAKNARKKAVCSMIYCEWNHFIPFEEQQQMIDQLDACIFLNQGEVERAREFITVPDEKIHIIPNGIDDHWFKSIISDTEIVPFVLTVGRIEPGKGQMGVAKACEKLGIKYLCIGESIDEDYAKACENYGAVILPPMKQYDLVKYYASCSVFALVSTPDVYPLVAMEAGAQCKNIVLGTQCCWKPTNAEFATFNDADSIETALLKSLNKKPNTQLRDELKTQSWESVAREVKKVYEQI